MSSLLLSGCGLNVGCLPLVGGAVTTTEGVGLGILEGVQYGFIDRAEVHAEHFVDFVDHLAAVAYSEAVLGSSQAVLWMQDNLSSEPAVYIMKHMPPERSAWVRAVSSADLAEDPTLKRPNPKIRVKTSEVLEALAKKSDAISTKGATIVFYFK